MSSGRRDGLVGAAEHELAGVQDERLIGRDLDEVGELGLVFGRIDERVLVVVEQPEEAVEPHVDRRRLHHRRVVGLETDAIGGEFGLDVTVGEQHVVSLTARLLVFSHGFTAVTRM